MRLFKRKQQRQPAAGRPTEELLDLAVRVRKQVMVAQMPGADEADVAELKRLVQEGHVVVTHASPEKISFEIPMSDEEKARFNESAARFNESMDRWVEIPVKLDKG